MAERREGFCPNCGAQVRGDSRFCSNCGQVLGEDAPPIPPQPDSIPTENVSVPPPPSQGSGGAVRKVLAGCASVLVILFLIVIIAALLAPTSDQGGESAVSQDGAGETSEETFTNENYGELFSDPNSHDGARVEVAGQLLGSPEPDGSDLAFQMYADVENLDWNTIVYLEDTNLDIAADDYVRVEGVAAGAFSGENAFGAAIEAPIIEAENVEVLSAAEALDPTQQTLEVGETLSDQGFSVTLARVEFGTQTTRAYITVNNETPNQVYFYSFDSRILQGQVQIGADESFLYEVEEPQSEIAPGVQTEGVIPFEPVDPSQPFQVQFEWSSDDFNIVPGSVTFDVSP